jgi:two-component system cell cycle sensor histidine kinase/response regulator CckA
VVMPGMLGREVAARVAAVRPALPALFISGYAQPIQNAGPALDRGRAFAVSRS